MTDANEAVVATFIPLSRAMPDTFSPSSPQQRRSTLAPRRTSSAPDLRTPSSLDSTSAFSSDEPISSVSSSSSRSSYSHREWRPHEFHQPRPHIAPLTHTTDARRVRSPPSASAPTEPHPAPPAPANDEQISQNVEAMARRLEDMHRTLSRRQRSGNGPTLQGLWVAARGFFGYGPEGTVSRRELVSLTGKLLFGAGQIAATIALLYIGSRDKSPTNDRVNEWRACRRPLGAWCSIWCVRVVLGCLMAIWGYRRRTLRLNETAQRLIHGEAAQGRASHASPTSAFARPGNSRMNSGSPPARPDSSSQISTATFARLTTLLSLLSLTWFITAHILVYTSIHTCRLSAPHLWWLTFGIICIGYLVIVEVILVAFLVFILGPLIFLFLNIILICMGRNPLRVPTQINPEVGKLPRKAVDRIPLVLYIPAPASKEAPAEGGPSRDSPSLPRDTPAAHLPLPEPVHVHSYPPERSRPSISPTSTQGTRVQSRSRRLFTFRRIRIRRSPRNADEKGKEKQSGTPAEEGYHYEDKWEKGEYPFVKLENNRAACAICLCDFEEPRRIRHSLDSRPPEDLDQAEKGLGVDTAAEEEGLKLADAGEGAQPLRLLGCAHVFHKTCLDPWLTEVSGRCPVCQRPVEVPEVPKSERTSRRRGRREG